MNKTTNNFTSLAIVSSFCLTLSACGGGSSSSGGLQPTDNYSAATESSSNVCLKKSTNPNSHHIQQRILQATKLNKLFAHDVYISKTASGKEESKLCQSGSVDHSIDSNNSYFIAHFDQCDTGKGIYNGKLEGASTGDVRGFYSSAIGQLNLDLSFEDFSIQGGENKVGFNGTIKQDLKWNSKEQRQESNSSNLRVTLSSNDSVIDTLEFSNYNNTHTLDLSSKPILFSNVDNFTAYYTSSRYTGELTLATKTPVTGYMNGKIISGQQIITDNNNQQFTLKSLEKVQGKDNSDEICYPSDNYSSDYYYLSDDDYSDDYLVDYLWSDTYLDDSYSVNDYYNDDDYSTYFGQTYQEQEQEWEEEELEYWDNAYNESAYEAAVYDNASYESAYYDAAYDNASYESAYYDNASYESAYNDASYDSYSYDSYSYDDYSYSKQK